MNILFRILYYAAFNFEIRIFYINRATKTDCSLVTRVSYQHQSRNKISAINFFLELMFYLLLLTLNINLSATKWVAWREIWSCTSTCKQKITNERVMYGISELLYKQICNLKNYAFKFEWYINLLSIIKQVSCVFLHP